MNIKKNYSSYWDSFKPFLNSLSTDSIIKISGIYFKIKSSKVSKEEKCLQVQELITTTKQNFIKLSSTKPKAYCSLEDPLQPNQTIIFPDHLKLRTYRDVEWMSPKFNTNAKISKLLDSLTEEVRTLGTKAFYWSALSQEQIDSILYYPGLSIYPILKYIQMHLASPVRREETKKFMKLRKTYSDKQVLNILPKEDKETFLKWLRVWNNKLTEFEVLSWLLSVFINNPLKELITSPIYLGQHWKLNTIFGEVYW